MGGAPDTKNTISNLSFGIWELGEGIWGWVKYHIFACVNITLISKVNVIP